MYVCICKKVTDSQIRRSVLQGDVSHLRQLRHATGACGDCGLCCREAAVVIKEALNERELFDACVPAI